MSKLERMAEREFEAEFERLQKENTELKKQLAIIKEKIIKVLDKQIWHLIKDNNLFTDFWHPASKDLFFGEIANEILEEE